MQPLRPLAVLFESGQIEFLSKWHLLSSQVADQLDFNRGIGLLIGWSI